MARNVVLKVQRTRCPPPHWPRFGVFFPSIAPILCPKLSVPVMRLPKSPRSLPLLGLVAGLANAATPDFERQIQPLLAEHCQSCHGERKQESGLRLDHPDLARQGGDHGPALIPGNAADSLLIQVVQGQHPELPRMPHRKDPLSPAEIGTLKDWIQAGAEWPATAAATLTAAPPHWAFNPVQRPVPPSIPPALDTGHPIDRFIRARLSALELQPSPEADRPTLLRRVSLDLTGLPPSPADVDAFVADTAADAFEKRVEALLESPHYGERWARWWLDAARYADSNGFEKDRTRTIWPWRDWVIQAFNSDKPFDQFTVEQLAGDLLPDAGIQERVATGFLRNSMVNMEGGIEPEKFRVEAMIDRVDCVTRTWLGITLACAQCHNHKYDPLSQAEYFRFYAFLNQDDEPRLEIPDPGQQARRDAILADARAIEDRARDSLTDAPTRLERWLADTAARTGSWEILSPQEWHSQPMKFEKLEDLSLLGGGDIWNNSVVRLWIDVPHTNITGFRLEALNDANLPFNGPGMEGDGGFNLCEFTVDATPLSELANPDAGSTQFKATTNRIAFSRALADAWADGGHPTNAIDGVLDRNGWYTAFTKGRRNQERRIVFESAEPFGFPGGTRLHVTLWHRPKDSQLSNHLIGRFRLALTTQSTPLDVDPLSVAQRAVASLAPAARTPAQQRDLFREWFLHDPAFASVATDWDAAWKDWPRADLTTLALSHRPLHRATRIFKRGDWTRPTTEVEPGVPAILNPLPADAPPNRLGLAQWIVDPANPLTSRVIVNRVWQSHFGQGLVITPEDFGTRADLPSHPELLDWLAREWIQPVSHPGTPWSLKRLHRLIVTSATYRQSSRVTPDLIEKDPYNRWLARGPRFRVDAEMVQDIALQAAGLLSPKVGGPSVFPPLPEGTMSLSYGPIPWNVSPGDNRYRRALYTFWKRSVPYPALTAFDAPTADQSCVRRMRSNTPLQALVTLNEPTLNNAARWLGWRSLQQGGSTDESRAVHLFRQVLGRLPDPAETAALVRLAHDLRADFAGRSGDAPVFAFSDPQNPPPLATGATAVDAAAWTGVARAVLNLDEAITKE